MSSHAQRDVKQSFMSTVNAKLLKSFTLKLYRRE